MTGLLFLIVLERDSDVSKSNRSSSQRRSEDEWSPFDLLESWMGEEEKARQTGERESVGQLGCNESKRKRRHDMSPPFNSRANPSELLPPDPDPDPEA